MGSGKSTIGKKLAGLLELEHIDLDWFFEETYRISINDFFGKYDESAFRNIENQLVKKTAALENCIISTGGGTPCFHGNMDLINDYGISIYIHMQHESLFERLKKSKKARPRISQLTDVDLLKRINDDLRLRAEYYEMAGLKVKGEDIDINALAAKIQKL